MRSGNDEQVPQRQRALQAHLFGDEMQSLAQRRPSSVHLAQLEKDRVEEVIDDELTAPHPMKTTRGLPDENRSLAHLRPRPCALRHQPGRNMFSELLREMNRANSAAGHPLSDHTRSGDHNREPRPSMPPPRR